MRAFLGIILLFSIFISVPVFSQTLGDPQIMFKQANEHFVKGEYNEAIVMYDSILEIAPNNISTLKMKAIALSNSGYHEKSLKEFVKILQYQPDDVTALTGMGIGFGNLGEYQEAKHYFEEAVKRKPDSIVINNYKEFTDKVIAKYPYIATEKPDRLEKKETIKIPDWVKPVAKWWSEGQIKDTEFASALLFMIENKIIQIPPVETKSENVEKIPDWIRNNASWWAENAINDSKARTKTPARTTSTTAWKTLTSIPASTSTCPRGPAGARSGLTKTASGSRRSSTSRRTSAPCSTRRWRRWKTPTPTRCRTC